MPDGWDASDPYRVFAGAAARGGGGEGGRGWGGGGWGMGGSGGSGGVSANGQARHHSNQTSGFSTHQVVS